MWSLWLHCSYNIKNQKAKKKKSSLSRKTCIWVNANECREIYLCAWTYVTMLSVTCSSTGMETDKKKKWEQRDAIHFLYHLCSTTHQHSLHWQLHCIPTSSSISSHSTQLHQSTYSIPEQIHMPLSQPYHVCGVKLFRECMHGEVRLIQSW